MSRSVVFIIQGEGRGHLTQALSLKQILDKEGIVLKAVLIGKSSARNIPDFFVKKIDAPLELFESPNFVMDKKFRGIDLGQTIQFNLRKIRGYRSSLKHIESAIRNYNPDQVINFFEPLTGYLYGKKSASLPPLICIAHQYIFLHPEYKFPASDRFQARMLRFFTRLTSRGSKIRLALSLYPVPDLPEKNIIVIPPLLRSEIAAQEIKNEDFILLYLLNEGLIEDVIRWHEKHPQVSLHCFTDKKDMEEQWNYSTGLTFHALSDTLFLNMMARCKGLVATAGFESIGEAMFLGKPVLMMPVPGHFEQFCNSRDAASAGAGVYTDNHLDLSLLLDSIKDYDPEVKTRFRKWSSEGQLRIFDWLR